MEKIDIAIITIIVAVLFLFCAPLFKNINYQTDQDEWLFTFAFNYFSRMCILKYHQLPLWSPFCGGGIPIIGHPYQGFINPLFIFVLFFGEIVGLKIIILIIYASGGVGMYYLTRFVFNYHPFASGFSSMVFCLSSYLPSFVSDGNYPHIYGYFLPWAFAMFLMSVYNYHNGKIKVRYMVFCSLVLSLIMIQAGFVFVVVSSIIFSFTLLNMIAFDFKKRKVKIDSRYFKIFLCIIILTTILCAIKLIPMVRFIELRVAPVHFVFENDYRSISDYAAAKETRALNWQRLYDSLFLRHYKIMLPAMYVGFIPIIFSLLALVLKPKENVKWLVYLASFLFLCMGKLAPIDLFRFLWLLHPYFHFIYQYNKYFSLGIIFAISILSGSFLSYLYQKCLYRKLAKYNIVVILFSIAALITVVDLFNTNIYFHKNIFTQSAPRLKEQNEYFQIFLKDAPLRKSTNKHQYYYLLQNIGLINWNGTILLRESTSPKYFTTIHNWKDLDAMELNPAYKGEFYFLSQHNEVKCHLFSPNKFSLTVRVKEPDTLVINQNYSTGWRVNTGKPQNYGGLLSIKLNRLGNYNVVLNYLPIDFWMGFCISLISLINIAYRFVRI